MDDLISRSALLAKIKNQMPQGSGGTISQTIDVCTDVTVELVKDAPAVDAVPVVHGRWVNYRKAVIGLATIWSAECSACGCGQVHKFEKYKYCPNCGAKMDGERRENETD